MEKRELSVGVYESTPAFKSIQQHSCVCFADDLGLVAVTGPAGDKESEEYADLFAASFDMLEALEALLKDVEFAQPQIEAGLIGNRQIKNARAAIAKARGKE